MVQKGKPRFALSHDDFVAETPGSDDQEHCTDNEKSQAVGPKMLDTGPAEDDAASDVDEIGGRNQVADRIEECGHGFARENIPRKENARKNRQKSQLHSLGLRFGF